MIFYQQVFISKKEDTSLTASCFLIPLFKDQSEVLISS